MVNLKSAFRRHSHDLVPLTNFFTTDPEIDRVLIAVRDILRKYKVPAYDEIHNKGEVRYLDVRRSKASGEIMVILVCSIVISRNCQKLPLKLAKFRM